MELKPDEAMLLSRARGEIEGNQQSPLTVLCRDRDGAGYFMRLEFGSKEDKEATLEVLENFFLWRRITSYTLSCEVWLVTRDRDNLPKGAAADCEDRQEALSLLSVDGEVKRLLLFPITSSDGNRQLGTVPQVSEANRGRLANLMLLPGGDVPAHVRHALDIIFEQVPTFPMGDKT